MTRGRGFPLVSALALLSCAKFQGDDTTLDAGPAEGGAPEGGAPESGVVEAGPKRVVASGNLFEFGTTTPVPDVTVSAGATTTKSDESGHFAIAVDANVPFVPRFSANKFSSLVGDEVSIGEDKTFAQTFPMVTEAYAGTLTSLYLNNPPYDTTRGALAILLYVQGTCGTRQGATFRVLANGKPEGVVRYFSGLVPNQGATSAGAQELLSAIVYNLPPGIDLQVEVVGGNPTTCRQLRFPVVYEGVTFTGRPPQVKTGATLMVTNVFLGGP